MFNIDFLNTLPFPIAIIIVITVAVGIFTTLFICGFLISAFFNRQRVQRRGDKYYVVKGSGVGKLYLTYHWGQPDWTYSRNYAGIWHDRDTALTHLTRPPGPYRKWKQKQEYKRVRAEQEARLKAHQEKMLKVRLDFSNYGGTD